MRAFRIVVGVLTGLMMLALLIGLLLPGDYHVKRSTTIEAPPSLVFEQVNDLRRWTAWSPWVARDPGMRNRYGGPRSGRGQSVSWKSESLGEGSQAITLSEPPERIETSLDMGEMGVANATWIFEARDDTTRVTWSLSGVNEGPIGHYFSLVMDDLVGPDYEDGLARLKAHAEKLAKQTPRVGVEAVANTANGLVPPAEQSPTEHETATPSESEEDEAAAP